MRSRLVDLQWIRIEVILPVELGQQEIIAWLCAAQVKRDRQFCLCTNSGGNPGGTGNPAHSISIASHHNGIRPAFAEAGEDQIHMQQGCGQIQRRMRSLLPGVAKGGVVGEIEGSFEDRCCLLTGRRILDDDSVLPIPISCTKKADEKARGAQGRNRRCARGEATSGGTCGPEIEQRRQTMVTRGYVADARIGKGEGSRSRCVSAEKGIVGTLRGSCPPRLPLRIGAQLLDKPLLGIDLCFNRSRLSPRRHWYQT